MCARNRHSFIQWVIHVTVEIRRDLPEVGISVSDPGGAGWAPLWGGSLAIASEEVVDGGGLDAILVLDIGVIAYGAPLAETAPYSTKEYLDLHKLQPRAIR